MQVPRESTRNPQVIHNTPPRFAPFRGWRYAATIPLAQVLTPPYDVIDEHARRMYEQRHPYNIIRLILGDPRADRPTSPEAYQQAAQTLRSWQREGILQQEDQPAFYVLRQRFSTFTGEQKERVGLIGRLLLSPWGEGILPHEKTFPTAKADRLALLKATHAHFSPIFALYPDPQAAVRGILQQTTQLPEAARFTDDQGVEHTLWVLRDEHLISRLAAHLQTTTFYVADGHHRYETALNYQRWMREQYPDAPPGQPYDYAFFYVAAFEDPGVTILPTHRALHPSLPVQRERVLAAAAQAYDVTPVSDDEALLRWLHRLHPGDSNVALVFPDGPAYKLHLRLDRSYVQEALSQVPPPIGELAVYHVQRFLLGPGVGIGETPQEQKRVIAFRPDGDRLVQEVRQGRWSMVVLVAATSLAQLRAIADARLIAPPKATYFYPKLPSGLVIYQVRSSD